jgi:hypothetical protein
MAVNGKLGTSQVIAAEEASGLDLLDDWLRIEDEHTNPGYMLPTREAVVAWCENHPGTVVLSANAMLWTPILWAMYHG